MESMTETNAPLLKVLISGREICESSDFIQKSFWKHETGS
jgi:hypothetical protein